MEWLIVSALILSGIAIILIEIIFVPGTTFVGVAGFVIAAYGTYLGYEYFGTPTGHFILGVSGLLMIASIIIAFKSNAWERFSLKESMTAKVNYDFQLELEVGEVGESTSSLRPIGKALFRDKEVEVRTNGDYVRENQKIKVIKIEGNKVFVEPFN